MWPVRINPAYTSGRWYSKRLEKWLTDWSREESCRKPWQTKLPQLLAAEALRGSLTIKQLHRRALIKRLSGRSEQSVEFKHANISAVLIDLDSL